MNTYKISKAWPIWPCLVSVTLVIFLAFGCSKETKTNPERTVKIAALLPISGPNAAQGIGMMNSCEAAIRDINDSKALGNIHLELMDRLGLANADMVGASIGGWIAAEMASKSPERFKKLVLVSPVGVKVGRTDKLDIAVAMHGAWMSSRE